jgi:hypothetical protein
VSLSLGFNKCVLSKEHPAPNPNPLRWKLLEKAVFEDSYVLKIKYLDATNFDGVKIMVYRGKYSRQTLERDPHFREGEDSPVARFRPDEEGWRMAIGLAATLSNDNPMGLV